MNEQDKWAIRDVLVILLADGKVTETEKQFIEGLRQKLGVDDEEFRQLIRDVRKDRKKVKLPSGGMDAEAVLRMMTQAATVDGEIGDAEQRVLERISLHLDRIASEVKAGLTDDAPSAALSEAPESNDETLGMAEEIYTHFGEWDDQTRRQKFDAIAAFGSAGVLPLLRMMESYRTPDNGDVREMKVMVVECMASLKDPRCVYYLAQQVSLGDSDDEVTNPALREATAEAIGRIVGVDLTRDEAGVQAARAWWLAEGSKRYNTLAL